METVSAPDLDTLLLGLADPTRRRVVELLRERPHRAGELTRRLHTSGPAMSRHLRLLLDSGIIADDRPAHDARQRVFRLERDAFAALAAWARQMQAEWDRQLRSFKEHIERGGRR